MQNREFLRAHNHKIPLQKNYALCFYLVVMQKSNTFTPPGRRLKRILLKQGIWGGRKP
jgi:hypothetical protein